MIPQREFDAMRLLAHALMGAGKFAQARDLLVGMVQTNPDDVFAGRNLVHARLRLGEYAEAEPLARRLAGNAQGNDRAPALFFHAHALWGCGRLEESRAAVDAYVAALKGFRSGEGRRG